MSASRTAVIIGAGPAGLTAALELTRRTDVRPIVLEASSAVGGLSRTVNCDGYRMDIGGHRFFSKSDWVMQWWLDILPLDPAAGAPGSTLAIAYRNHRRDVRVAQPQMHVDDPDRVMLVRDRLSRIYFLRKFFDYPITLNARTFANLGPWRVAKAAVGYARASMSPCPERTLEDFLINRFGAELYRTFFKAYTEKVWGVPCSAISADWGAQRIRGLSLRKAVLHALKRASGRAPPSAAPTSLVDKFLYPKLGPGQLWEEVARRVVAAGGEIRFAHRVGAMRLAQGRAVAVVARDETNDALVEIAADHVISTMPVKELVECLDPGAPDAVRRVASRLPYRSFITVGVRARGMHPRFARGGESAPRLPDNWIYVQDPDVRLGRVQIFNNWSPALVPDDRVWLGLEYFCDEGDALWSLDDAAMQALAVRELETIELVLGRDVEAASVVRVPKAYPAYFGAYAEFDTIRRYLDAIPNLFLVGRNGMHRYNNQDHSMLTARAAVDNIAAGRTDKANLWDINVDDDYHEERNDAEA